MTTTIYQTKFLMRAAVALSLAALAVGLFLQPRAAHADSGLSVTVTPPLIQLSIGPGQSWTSDLKVVNNNTYDVTYYTQLVDMQANGEDGGSRFIPLVNENQNDPAIQSFALARWITLSPEPILIKAGETGVIPFTVNIPANAEPGGHYAAILIGTQPGTIGGQQGALTKVSSYVSSLIFVQIKGDALESGRIREFTTSQAFYQTPDVDFTVRFENTGNTHVHPEGSVTIYNMWGKERGQVMINNQDADFGNVLPQSIRRFKFSWSGEQSLMDIGPYSAIATLNYGSDGKKSVSATAYFWVVPLVPVSIAIATIIFFILTVMWLIRRYVRRALKLEQMRYGIRPTEAPATLAELRTPVIETLMEPIREGVIDLRSLSSKKSTQQENPSRNAVLQPAQMTATNAVAKVLTPYQFGKKYRLFFVFLIACIAICITLWWFFARVLQPHGGYQISNVTIQSEPVTQ